MSTLLTVKPAFSDASIQAAVDLALSNLPAEKQGALVAHFDGSTAVLSVAERMGSHFILKGAAIWPWGGKLSAAAEIVGSW